MGSRRDSILAIGLVVLVAVLALVTAPAREEGGVLDLRPSTFHRSPNGALALFRLLEELDIPAERRLTPYLDADSLQGPLALLAPAEPPTPAELAALDRWIRSGGTLVYAARPGDPTLDTLGLALDPVSTDDVPVAAVPRAGPLGAGIDSVSGFQWIFADSSRALQRGETERLLVAPGGELVTVGFRRGTGRVIAWSDPSPLVNAELRESGAALFFTRLAAELTSEGRPLHFDEYHQGYRAGGGPVAGTWEFLRDHPLGHVMLQLAVAGLGLLLLLGRRFGAPYLPSPARRRSPLEHVEALAGAYRGAGARGIARRRLLAGLARRLGRPVPREGAEPAFLEELTTRLPAGRDTAEALLNEWRRGERADMVVLGRRMDDLIAETTQR